MSECEGQVGRAWKTDSEGDMGHTGGCRHGRRHPYRVGLMSLSLFLPFCFGSLFCYSTPNREIAVSDSNLSLTLCSVILKGKPSKSDFPDGLHKMSYTVFDRAGNKGSCRFTVRVRGELNMQNMMIVYRTEHNSTMCTLV